MNIIIFIPLSLYDSVEVMKIYMSQKDYFEKSRALSFLSIFFFCAVVIVDVTRMSETSK
jgi:hypothetical protein